jgi:hypothetical protein
MALKRFKFVRRPITPSKWPKSIIEEVRAIRNDVEAFVEREVPSIHTTVAHGCGCEFCGEAGSHVCIEELKWALEQSPEFLEMIWGVYEQLKGQQND